MYRARAHFPSKDLGKGHDTGPLAGRGCCLADLPASASLRSSLWKCRNARWHSFFSPAPAQSRQILPPRCFPVPAPAAPEQALLAKKLFLGTKISLIY